MESICDEIIPFKIVQESLLEKGMKGGVVESEELVEKGGVWKNFY